MSKPPERLFLTNAHTLNYERWVGNLTSDGIRILITTSGYEERSTYWINKTIKKIKPSDKNIFITIGFNEYRNELSRKFNDEYYIKKKIKIEIPKTDGWTDFRTLLLELFTQKIGADLNKNPIEIHVDYSCMPRVWYCRLPMFLETYFKKSDKIFFWYTPGEYPKAEYPSAGVEDFQIFSGKPSLSPLFRTHIFGLGFDRIRSQAIWSVIDPDNLICFYSEPGTRPGYVERVKKDNKELLQTANYTFTVPINDFIYMYSKIASIVQEFKNMGDVIIVPDGPKPLILASSLVPLFLNQTGIVCFHVTKNKNIVEKLVDVKPAGEPFGFNYYGTL